MSQNKPEPKDPWGIKGAIYLMRLITRVASIGQNPLGVIIIGESGKGKSFLITRFSPVEVGGVKKSLVEVVAEATRWGIQDFLISQRERIDGGYICFTDLTALSKRQDFANITSWFLQALEEGLTAIKKKNEVYNFEPPLHLGVIAAITTQEWNKHRGHWLQDGFFQRLLQVRIDMARSDRIRVRHEIRRTDIEYKRYEIRRIPVASIVVPNISDEDGIISALTGCMADFVLKARKKESGVEEEVFRIDKTLSRLAMAAASFYTPDRNFQVEPGQPIFSAWLNHLKNDIIRVDMNDLYMVAQTLPYMVLKSPHDVHWYIMREFKPNRHTISHKEIEAAVTSKGYTKEEVYLAVSELINAGLLVENGGYTHLIEALRSKAEEDRREYFELSAFERENEDEQG